MMLWSVIAFERLRERGTIWALFFALILPVTTPVTSAAVEGNSPAVPVVEQTGEAPRPAVVKGNANLRAAPSMEGNILAIAKEGTVVQILEEASRWYRVKTDDGTEAWIYKALVLVLQMPAGSLSSRAPQPVAPTPTQPPGASAERQPPPAPEQTTPSTTPPLEQERPPSSPVPQATPVSEPVPPVRLRQDPPQPVQPSGSASVNRYVLFQGVNGYLTGALVLVLLVTIALNLRTSRQLKRAMREGLQESTARLVSVRAARRIKQRTYEGAQVTRHPTPERRVTAGVSTLPQPPGSISIADPSTDLSPL
ncbi:MAG: SH3 domain-containing protein, partial [Candidatus Entotheonellia bacterium]